VICSFREAQLKSKDELCIAVAERGVHLAARVCVLRGPVRGMEDEAAALEGAILRHLFRNARERMHRGDRACQCLKAEQLFLCVTKSEKG
jgi:hypothetical protein